MSRFATAKEFIAEWDKLGEKGRPQDQAMCEIISQAQIYFDPDKWYDLAETEKMAVLVAARELGYLASDVEINAYVAAAVLTAAGKYPLQVTKSKIGPAGLRRERGKRR